MHGGVVDGVCVAAGHSFFRTIGPSHGELDVLALGGVATDPDHQGKGFGQEVVRDAFKRVVNGEVAVCLFQTGPARGFYERLGCVVVDNRFVNGAGDPPDQNPWIDEWVMQYPANAHWPEGEMDLRGAGY